MRKLTFGMNLSLDGYIAAPGDDLGWSVPSDELFQWWSDRVGATGLALYGRRLWETMSSHWPTADEQPSATPAEIEFASRWRDMPKVVFSSTTSTVDWNTRLVTGDAVTEITRLKADDGGPMDIGGATLAAAAMRAGLIDEYAIVTHPVLVGGGTPFFTALDNWVNLSLLETRTFPDGVVLTRYETGSPGSSTSTLSQRPQSRPAYKPPASISRPEHGPRGFMTHLAMQEADDQGNLVGWGEHVTDQEHGAAPSA